MLCLDVQMRHYLVWNALTDMSFERSRLNWIPVSVCWHVEVKCFVAEEKNNISLSFVLLFYHLNVFIHQKILCVAIVSQTCQLTHTHLFATCIPPDWMWLTLTSSPSSSPLSLPSSWSLGEICAFNIHGLEAPFEAVVLNGTSGEGQLRARGLVDCELQKEYTFIIQAHDCGSGPGGTEGKKSHKWVRQTAATPTGALFWKSDRIHKCMHGTYCSYRHNSHNRCKEWDFYGLTSCFV